MSTQKQAREAFELWRETGTLNADKETIHKMIKMLTYIIDAAIGIKAYQLMVGDAINNKYKLEDIYKARFGEAWKVK